MADQDETFERARAVACPACSAKPKQHCSGSQPGSATGGFVHGARILEAGVLPEPDPTIVARLASEARDRNERLTRDVLPEATRRLLRDPLLVARARVVAGLIRADRQGVFARDWDSRRDQPLAEWAAAVALVVAERPELITGEPPSGRPVAEVLAEYFAPLVGYLPMHGTDGAATLTRNLLQALELAGHEIVFRADRFASLERDASQIRMPLRGTCGVCGGAVRRHLISSDTEALLGGWFHVDGGGYGHDPAEVVAP